MDTNNLKIAVISGGTATNQLVTLFKNITPNVSYILPISDNGGSTSELIRVIGGPAIGDIRSRLTRLIPPNQESLSALLSYRLSGDPSEAKSEWNEIVDGTHVLWKDINSATKEIFRAFFIHVHVELLKRSKHQFSNHVNKKLFRFELASIGNLFLTGVRLFIGSLDSAIELFAKMTGIDADTQVLPCINTNFTYHISALLENGLIITGQSQISHPSSNSDAYPPPLHKTRPSTPSHEPLEGDYFESVISDLKLDVPINEVALSNLKYKVEDSEDSDEESGNVPQYTHPELKKSQLHFRSDNNLPPLMSPIKRIFYISPYGEEIRPTAHNRVTTNLANSDVIVYSIGSLMTSIVPVVILKGVGKAIASELSTEGRKKKRVFLLNGCLDRETFGMNAFDFVKIIVDSATYSLNESDHSSMDEKKSKQDVWSKYISHLVYIKDSKIPVDVESLSSKGVRSVEVEKDKIYDHFNLEDLEVKLKTLIEEE